MAQQATNTQSRQVNSYPSPTSYPSPSMTAPGGYTYPAPTSGQGAEPYRAGGSPTGSNNSLPPLNLPPLRGIDGRSPTAQQQQQGHGAQQSPSGQPTSGQNAMGSPLAPHMNQYYQAQQSLPPPPPHMSGSDAHNALRYPIPASNDTRMMSGGRHKKEIKRRTKTGCLTCRRRRIKCDEAHPTCKNCIKSKRDCLGYDPIFKAQPGPAAIQPAPSSAPSMNPLTTTSSSYPPPPQGYMPASSQPFAPSMTAGVTSPDSSAEQFDYGTAIDPALEAAGSSQMQVQSSLYDGTHEAKLGGNNQPVSYSGPSSTTTNTVNGSTPTSHYANKAPITAKPTKIEELLNIGGVPPPDYKPLSSLPPSLVDAVKALYNTAYANAIDKFLETRWFSTRGLTHLLADQALCERYSHLAQRFENSASNPPDFRQDLLTQSLEAHVIWQTMLLCRQVSAKSTNGSSNYIEINEGVHDAAKRLEVFETLVTNQHLDNPEPLSTLNQPAGPQNGLKLDTALKFRESEFWRLVSKFLTIRDDEAAAANHLDDILAEIRKLLDSRENRDVIYSIAIARHIGQRMAEGSKPLGLGDRGGELNNDENDPRNKLKVARTFVESEANGRGTTQVVTRLCAMAIRSWGNR